MASESAGPYRGHTLVSDPAFWEAVNAKQPDLVQIKAMISQAHERETGHIALTEKELSSWLSMAINGNPEFRKGVSAGTTPQRQIILPNLAIKFGYILRRPCFVCMAYQKIDFIAFHLHTEPVSRQANRQSAFKQAVRSYLTRVNHDFTDFYNARLCVAVLFAMRSNAPATDVDNMAKTVLDALQGYAYANDRQIDHLDAIRLNSGSKSESFIGIRIAVTGVAGVEDVIWPEFDVTWIPTQGVTPIDLAPYLPTARGQSSEVSR